MNCLKKRKLKNFTTIIKEIQTGLRCIPEEGVGASVQVKCGCVIRDCKDIKKLWFKTYTEKSSLGYLTLLDKRAVDVVGIAAVGDMNLMAIVGSIYPGLDIGMIGED